MSNEALTDELGPLFKAAGMLQFDEKVIQAQLQLVNVKIDEILKKTNEENEKKKAQEAAADVAGA